MAQLEFTGFQAVKCHPQKDLKNFDSFLFAAVIGAKVKRFEYWVIRQRWERRSVTNKRGVTNQNLRPSSVLPDYFGLSTATMAKTLNMSQSRAGELKNEAEEHGYLKCNNKFCECCKGNRKAIQTFIDCVGPEVARKVKVIMNGNGVLTASIQLHDEIIPQLAFLTVRQWKRSRQRKYGNERSVVTEIAEPAIVETPF
jgi:hypothetical protein